MPKEEKAKYKLEDLNVFKVDIVSKPSTGDKFIVVRSEDENDQEVERQVPDKDASDDTKRKSQKKRSEKYEIEALEDKGENLSYPKNDPTKEALYGDPVNLKFPLGRDDNKIDQKRANNARTRFKQFADTYSKKKSKKIVHTRIIEAQLKAGSNPAFDPEDPLDKMLPKDTKNKMKQPVNREDLLNNNESEEMQMSKLDATVERLESVVERMASVFEGLDLAKKTESSASEKDEVKADETNSDQDNETKTEENSASDTKADETNVDSEQNESQGNTQNENSEPESTEGNPPVETATVEVATEQITETQSAISSVADSVDKISNVVERLADETKSVKESVGGLVDRLDKVERSVRSEGNAQDQDDTEEVKRSKPSMWGNVLGPVSSQ
jgi:hypothetical protein